MPTWAPDVGDVSLNGWPVLDDGDSRIATGIIPGVGRPVTCAKAALPVFLHFYAAWQKEMGARMSIKVGPIDGHEVRQSRAASGFSNHASGSAVDVLYDSVLPADGEPHMTAAEKVTLEKILKRYTTSDGHRILANGEWWHSPYCDGMHTELSQAWDRGAKRNTTPQDVANVIHRLGIKADGTSTLASQVVGKITPAPKPAPAQKGAVWCSKFLTERGMHGAAHRIVWTLAGRESSWNPAMVYPAGTHDWKQEQPPFDTGLLQCNSVHLDLVRTLYGPSADLRLLLDPVVNLRVARELSKGWTDWTAWGIGHVNADGTVAFDWSQYPAAWLNKVTSSGKTQQQESEDGFLAIWQEYKAPAAVVSPTPVKPPASPTVSLSGVQRALWKDVRQVQAALNKVLGTRLVIDGKWGPSTQAAFNRYRVECMGLSGQAASGLPGIQSLTHLGNAAGLSVKP